MSHADRSGLIQLAVVPVLFYFGVKLSLAFAVLPEVVVMLWLPNSLLLAALLHYGMRRYAYFAGLIVAAEIAADYPTFTVIESALFGTINLLEVTIAWWLLRRWRFNPRFAEPSDIAKFLFAGPVIGAFASACFAAAVYKYVRGSDTTYLELLRVWWLSDGMGLLIVTPLILSLWPPTRGPAEERIALRWFDGVVALLALAVAGIFVMSDKGMFHGMQVRPLLLFPFVVYAAARLTPRATAIVVAGFAAMVLFVTRNGQQPFGAQPISETVLQVQQFIFLTTITSLGLAALLSQLRSNTRELESRVQDRTAELRAANEQLKRLTLTDPLTGLLNRRALFDLLRREMERNQRHRHELSVIMFDIDHFKDVNDRHGHNAGDAMLRHVATVSADVARSTDALARYGGEEFVIVAPETDETHAVQLAERIREALDSSEVPIDHQRLHVTASFGVATVCAGDKEPERVLGRADTALYAAKAQGRNRVVVDVPSAGSIDEVSMLTRADT